MGSLISSPDYIMIMSGLFKPVFISQPVKYPATAFGPRINLAYIAPERRPHPLKCYPIAEVAERFRHVFPILVKVERLSNNDTAFGSGGLFCYYYT